MALYHKEVYWPKRIEKKLPFGVIELVYTNHAIKEANSDRYGNIQLPNSVDMSSVSFFEAEEKDRNNRLDKVVFRVKMNQDADLIVVGIPQGKRLVVKTVWLNVNSDSHATLRKERYENVQGCKGGQGW